MRRPADIIINGLPLSERIRRHGLWMRGEEGGERLDLRGADLSGADLRDAILRDAILSRADLSRADLIRADLRDADLRGAILRDAILRDAILSRADLRGAIGNMREVKSAQFDHWPITWTTAPDGEVMLQIGCQRHPLAMWEKSDPRWIAKLDDNAPEWWARNGEAILALVKASPAVPYGEEKA